MLIRLQPYEYERAAQLGIERTKHMNESGWHGDYRDAVNTGRMVDRELANIDGAVLEMAFAKALNIYWPGHGGYKDTNKVYRCRPDVGDLEVRHVLNPEHGPLLTPQDEHNARQYAHKSGRLLQVASGYVEEHQAWLHGITDILEAFQPHRTCCKRYSNSGNLRVCRTHLTPIMEAHPCH
jgi:hypothetical protein